MELQPLRISNKTLPRSTRKKGYCFSSSVLTGLTRFRKETKISLAESVFDLQEDELLEPYMAAKYLVENNFNVTWIELFDLNKFAKNPSYFHEFYEWKEKEKGKKPTNLLIKCQNYLKQFINNKCFSFIKESPSIDRLKSLVKNNFMVIQAVNAHIEENIKEEDKKNTLKEHAVLIYKYDEKNEKFHYWDSYKNSCGRFKIKNAQDFSKSLFTGENGKLNYCLAFKSEESENRVQQKA